MDLFVLQIKNGSQFVSETDTEVIPKLLKFAYDNWEGERLPFPKVWLAWVLLQLQGPCLPAHVVPADRSSRVVSHSWLLCMEQ